MHEVQQRIADAHGSQCGFCTPGMVMSMYTLLRNDPNPSFKDMEAYFQVIVLCMFVIKLPTKYVSFSKFSRETCADAQVIVQFWRDSSHSLQAALVPKMGSVAWRTNRQPKVENTSLANSEEVKSFKISFACKTESSNGNGLETNGMFSVKDDRELIFPP